MGFWIEGMPKLPLLSALMAGYTLPHFLWEESQPVVYNTISDRDSPQQIEKLYVLSTPRVGVMWRNVDGDS